MIVSVVHLARLSATYALPAVMVCDPPGRAEMWCPEVTEADENAVRQSP
jgi:hypothetical protein